MHHYLALICDDPNRREATRDAVTATLGDDMSRRIDAGAVTFFVSRSAPVVPLPGGGFAFGELYPHPPSEPGALAAAKAPASRISCDDFLRRTWGEYIIFQLSPSVPTAFRLIRDPSGAVPCVYSIHDGFGFITSDISLAGRAGLYRRRIDWDELSVFLSFPHVKAGATALSDVRELLPGCALQYQTGRTAVEQAWCPWDYVAPAVQHRTYAEAVEAVHQAVSSVVTAWSAADQSILLELSGGVDSSIVAASLRDSRAHMVCCTLVPPIPGGDERHYASLAARNLGSELVVETLCLDEARFEYPLPQHAVLPRIGFLQHAIDVILQAAADRHGATSFYSGGGGDTVFSYLRTAAPAADALRSRGLRSAFGVIAELSELHQCTRWKVGMLTFRKLFRGPRNPYRPNTSFLSVDAPTEGPVRHPWLTVAAGALPGDAERVLELAGTQVFRDGAPRCVNP